MYQKTTPTSVGNIKVVETFPPQQQSGRRVTANRVKFICMSLSIYRCVKALLPHKMYFVCKLVLR